MTPSPNTCGAGWLRWPALASVSLAALLGASSCRTDLVGPGDLSARVESTPGAMPSTTRDDDPVTDIEAMVPAITQLHVEARGDLLIFRGILKSRSRGYVPFYGPSRIGGWSLQVFIGNDPRNAGYWMGYDYIVRGVEWSASSHTFVTRQITLDPDTPGGWGPETGLASFDLRSRSFQIAVPLSSIHGIDRSVDYCIETYATIACPDCGGGMTQEWAGDYFGTLSDRRTHDRDLIAETRPPGYSSLSAIALSPARNAAADPRLAGRPGASDR